MAGPVFNQPVEGVDDNNVKYFGVRGYSERPVDTVPGNGVIGESNRGVGVVGFTASGSAGVFGDNRER